MKIEKTLRIVFRREQSLSHAARAFLDLVKAGAIEKALKSTTHH
jgi:hypothetical protein